MNIKSPFGKANWYPHHKEDLIQNLDKYLHKCPTFKKKSINAIICPHAGYKYCGDVFGKSFGSTKGKSYDNIIILGPSHHKHLNQLFLVPTIDSFETELGISKVNKAFIDKFKNTSGQRVNNDLFIQEHSIWMMLPFIQHLHPNATISPMIIGDLSREQSKEVATIIKEEWSNTLLVISSDFTHFGHSFNYVPFTMNIPTEIANVDKKALYYIATNDSDGFWNWHHSYKTTICGRYSISVLLDFMNDNHHVMNSEYFQSGHLMNDWSHSVSYQSVVIGSERL